MKILYKYSIYIFSLFMAVSTFTSCDNSATRSNPDSVTGITLDKTSADISINSTEQLTATVEPPDAINRKIRWMSFDETIATVDETGLVTMEALGETTIIASAKDGGFTATCTVSALYNLRDRGPANGFVFYDKGSYSDGWRYLEAAPWDYTDNGTTVTWAWLNGSGSSHIAGVTVNGYSDWFIPSIDELQEMYNNLKSYSVGGFTDTLYWSSSPYITEFYSPAVQYAIIYGQGIYFSSGSTTNATLTDYSFWTNFGAGIDDEIENTYGRARLCRSF